MDFYQHRFGNVEDYLHHRPPYLLVDRIVSIELKTIVTETTIGGDEFFMAGHFPGAAVLPGAMMQEMTTQSAGILIAANYNPMARYNTHDPLFNEYALGVLVKVKRARFRGFVRPGDTVCIDVVLADQLSEAFDFDGQIRLNGKIVMQNSFQLVNIRSSELQGAKLH